jgi:hypothetical protein
MSIRYIQNESLNGHKLSLIVAQMTTNDDE